MSGSGKIYIMPMAISSFCSLQWFCPAFDGTADGSHEMNDEHRHDLTLKETPHELNYHTHCLGCLMFLLIYLNLVLLNLHHGLEAKVPNLLALATAEVAGHL